MGLKFYWPWQQIKLRYRYSTISLLSLSLFTSHSWYPGEIQEKLQCNILIIWRGRMSDYISRNWPVCGRKHWRIWHANKGIASTRFAVYQRSSVTHCVIWHKVSEKSLDPRISCQMTFTHTHTRRKEGEGQSLSCVKEGGDTHMGRGRADSHNWHTQFFLLVDEWRQ